MDIPRDKDHPADAVQCDACGGFGCPSCCDRGWHVPMDHPAGRRCANEACRAPLRPSHVAVYCSNDCALRDVEHVERWLRHDADVATPGVIGYRPPMGSVCVCDFPSISAACPIHRHELLHLDLDRMDDEELFGVDADGVAMAVPSPLDPLLHVFESPDDLEDRCTRCHTTTVFQLLGKRAQEALCPEALAQLLDRLMARLPPSATDEERAGDEAMRGMVEKLREGVDRG